uniref:Phosphoglycerate mutase family protein n=1 Tax=Steinernema glaseri TaxID=37863 RepID=A0A1I7YFG5_9BILA
MSAPATTGTDSAHTCISTSSNGRVSRRTKSESLMSTQGTMDGISSIASEAEDSITSLDTSVASLKRIVNVTEDVPKLSEALSSSGKRNPILLLTMSHAETVDSVFPDWILKAFPKDRDEPYHIFDLNIPPNMPDRPQQEYLADPPITEHGKHVASIVAIELQSLDLEAPVVYAAPEMKCIETAAEIVGAWKNGARIRVEPMLADCRGFHVQNQGGNWLSLDRMVALGYPIDKKYVPVMRRTELSPVAEEPSQYYERLLSFFQKIGKDDSAKTVLIVAHPTTVFFAEDGSWATGRHFTRIDRQIGTCEVSGIKIDAGGKVSHRQILKPFTRTLNDARELRKKGIY